VCERESHQQTERHTEREREREACVHIMYVRTEQFQTFKILLRLHKVTPLIRSELLSKRIDANVFLKMDFLQPSGSFKIRGIGRSVSEAVERGGAREIVSSSGGNAGLAASYAAMKHRVPITVVVPETTKEHVIGLLDSYGANVLVHGSEWDSANEHATRLAKDRNAFMIHPFEGEATEIGHSSVVKEISNQMSSRPDVIVTVCGGGGLLAGIIRGVRDEGWSEDVDIVACETEGAASLTAAVQAKDLVTLPAITSIATSLGSKTVSRSVLDHVLHGKENVSTYVSTDRVALQGCAELLRTDRILVEPACGITIGYLLENSESLRSKDIVVEICGGSGMSVPLFLDYCKQHDIPLL